MKPSFFYAFIIILFACNITPKNKSLNEVAEDKFIGSWRFFANNPPVNPNDHTMDAIVCELEKYKNTKETYVFHLSFAGQDLLLAIKDENNLTGINAPMTVHYEENTGHIILTISAGNEMIFSKLK